MAFIPGTHFIYTIRPGDTLFSIANRFNSSVQIIEEANSLYPPITDLGLIFPGQVLVIPHNYLVERQTLYVVNPGDTLYSMAQRFTTHPELIAGVARLPNPDLIFPDESVWVPASVYVVQSGDSSWAIQQRTGIPMAIIRQANQRRPGFSPDLLYPGFRLLIPMPSSRNIVVTEPYPGSNIQGGVTVSGYARAFEANILLEIRDATDVIVSAERFTTASEGAPAYGYFETNLPFDAEPTVDEGYIWVYTRSAKDGSIQDLVRVKVTL